MLNQYAVDNPTLPVNQCFSTSSSSWRNAEPSSGNAEPQQWAAKYLGHAWNIRKRFRKSNGVFSSAPYPQESNTWISNVSEHTSPHVMSAKHQFRIRDASQDRQPEIQSSPVREDFQRIIGQTNNDCRFQIFISTNSPRQPRLLAGREDPRLRYVLVHNFTRKLCCGSKKWRWLIQWMILNLRHQ